MAHLNNCKCHYVCNIYIATHEYVVYTFVILVDTSLTPEVYASHYQLIVH